MRAIRRIIGLGLVLALAAGPASAGDQKPAGNDKSTGNQKDDLFFSEAFYHAYQGQYFEAIQRLDTELAQYHRLDEPQLDTLHYDINEAEFWLARIHFQKDQLDDALQALGRIQGTVPAKIKDDVEFLRANIYMAT